MAHLVHVAIPLPSILWRDENSDASAVYALAATEPEADGTWRYRNRPAVVGHAGRPVPASRWRRHRTVRLRPAAARRRGCR